MAKILGNSPLRSEYLITSQKPGVDTRLKHIYSMGQRQDGTLPGYPSKETFNLQALFLEGFKEDQKEKITLRKAFGINDPNTYAAIMSANNVPAVIAGSINAGDCRKHNAGRNWRTDHGVICMWGNAAYFCLREYLITQCMRVSLDWVCSLLRIRAVGGAHNAIAKSTDAMIRLDRSDPNNLCLLNRDNLTYDKSDSSFTLTGDRVINVCEFSGDLKDVMRRCPVPCEFRVMHSAYLEDGEREQLAKESTDVTEKILSCDRDARVQLAQETNGGVVRVIYMVASMSEEEKQLYAHADTKWLSRRQAVAAAAASAAEAAPITEADADPYQQQDDGPVPMDAGGDAGDVPLGDTVVDPTLAGDTLIIDDQVEDQAPPPSQTYVDEDLEQEALRRQLEEEAEQERAREAQSKKRRAPPAAKSAQDEASSEDVRRGAASGKKKTTGRKAPKPE